MGQMTDKMIRAAQPGEVLSDDDGSRNAGRLILTVKKTGRKVWQFRNRQGGKDTTKLIGDYPDISLSEARAAVARLREKPELLSKTGTLEELLEAYRKHLGERRSADDVRKQINTNRDAALYKKEARAVTPSDISASLRQAVARGATTQVNRWRATLCAAFNFAAHNDFSPLRPADGAKFMITSNPVLLVPRVAEFEVARKRVLTDDELKNYIAGCRARNDAVGAFLELQLLTGQRIAQLHAAEFEEGLIVISDRKGRAATMKINRLPVLSEWGGLPERAALAVHATVNVISKAGNAILPQDANLLDIRRTVETRLQELGIDRETRGYILSHGSGVQQKHYEQAALLDRKRIVLRKWSNYLSVLCQSARN
jgi:hypothetical protein